MTMTHISEFLGCPVDCTHEHLCIGKNCKINNPHDCEADKRVCTHNPPHEDWDPCGDTVS